jgi:hypothetical protein
LGAGRKKGRKKKKKTALAVKIPPGFSSNNTAHFPSAIASSYLDYVMKMKDK